MQQLIASYLFQHKTCPLPGLGTIRVNYTNASGNFFNKTISAPQPLITFSDEETPAENLLDYITGKTKSNVIEAIEALGKFSNQLKSELNKGNKVSIDLVGSFFTDGDHKIHFTPAALPSVFLPDTIAERVIHSEDAHTMMVGDKQTTNMQMAEYYSDADVKAKSYWGWWAAVLAAIAILAVLIYYNSFSHAAFFGNTNTTF
jgi:hypothetical protein